MNTLFELLNSYVGRDSVIRATSYLALYFSGSTDGNISIKLRKISEELSYCRVILRLFDDLPMIRYTLNYGLGKQEKGILLRCFGLLKNIVDQIYYPLEHIAWAAEKKLINIKSSSFSFAGIALWAISSYLSIIRSLMIMSQLQKKTHGLKNLIIHENIVNEQLEYLLLAFKNVADFAIAINYFPPGSLLWAGKLDTKQIGLCGVISSFLHILMVVRHMRKGEGHANK